MRSQEGTASGWQSSDINIYRQVPSSLLRAPGHAVHYDEPHPPSLGHSIPGPPDPSINLPFHLTCRPLVIESMHDGTLCSFIGRATERLAPVSHREVPVTGRLAVLRALRTHKELDRVTLYDLAQKFAPHLSRHAVQSARLRLVREGLVKHVPLRDTFRLAGRSRRKSR